MSELMVIHPDGWLAPSGYSNAIVATGRIVAVAGQVGWDPRSGEIDSYDFAAQTAQALRNVVAVLASAGGRPEHLVRLTWFITNRTAYMSARAAIGESYRDIIGRHYPAMSAVIVAGLMEPHALVEIEATAVLPE